MLERGRTLKDWVFLAVTAVVAMFSAMVLVWMAFTALAGNVDIAYGLGINEEVAAWLELVPATLLTGVTVGLVARLRGWSLTMPALMSTALAAIVLGAYQIASIGRTSIEPSGESVPVYLSPPVWLMALAICGGALIGIMMTDAMIRRAPAEVPEEQPIDA